MHSSRGVCVCVVLGPWVMTGIRVNSHSNIQIRHTRAREDKITRSLSLSAKSNHSYPGQKYWKESRNPSSRVLRNSSVLWKMDQKCKSASFCLADAACTAKWLNQIHRTRSRPPADGNLGSFLQPIIDTCNMIGKCIIVRPLGIEIPRDE